MKPFTTAFLAALLLPQVALALPADVETSSWYASTVSAFVDAGYLNGSVPFRPTHNATRGEFVELIVAMLGGAQHAPFSGQSFDDVPTTSDLYPAFEEAGLTGWLKGTDNCYGRHPCSANPNSPINRAEAAAMIIRAFGLTAGDGAPIFTDNPATEWYNEVITTAASKCILKGDTGSTRVRPADRMNRAEMVVMLQRVSEKQQYPNCGAQMGASTSSAQSSSVQAKSSSSNSSASLPIDSSVTLSIIKFIAPTDTNIATLEENIECYTDGSHDAFVQEMRGFLFTLKSNSEMLEFLADQSKTRGLTAAEIDQVIKLEKEMNAAITDANALIKDGSCVQKSNSNTIYVQPVILPSEEPQVDCDYETRKAAMQGLTSSSSWYWYMVEIGCSTLEDYCRALDNGFGGRSMDSRCNNP